MDVIWQYAIVNGDVRVWEEARNFLIGLILNNTSEKVTERGEYYKKFIDSWL